MGLENSEWPSVLKRRRVEAKFVQKYTQSPDICLLEQVRWTPFATNKSLATLLIDLSPQVNINHFGSPVLEGSMFIQIGLQSTDFGGC